MTPEEKQQVPIALTHPTEKRDKLIKGQTVHNGKLMQQWPSWIEMMFLTTMSDANEERDVMTVNTPNAFTQASLKREKGKARVIVKIAGVLVKSLMKKAPHV